MSGEETILDAPVTPAPVFAYRALRGIFFNSPETPLPNTNRNISIGTDHNKENESTEKLSFRRVSAQLGAKSAPLRNRGNTNVGQSMLSPTKSCLRTPGATTPRRELLRDINVTFMDARSLSASPDRTSAQKPKNPIAPTKTRQSEAAPSSSSSHAPVQVAKLQTNPVAIAIRPSTKPTRNISPVAPPQVAVSAPAPTPVPDGVDMQTYMSTTEKEMKKLIRYSQKMREYARKQDEDNTKLKQLVEELQKENARLKRKADTMTTDGDWQTQDLQTGADDRKRRKVLEPVLQSPRTQAQQGISATVRENSSVDGVVGGNTRTGRDRARNELEPDHLQNVQFRTQSQSQVSVLDAARKQDPNARDRVGTGVPSRQSPRPRPQSPQNMANASVPGSNIAPDRLAAARARIRQKSEMRKASGTTTVHPVLQPNNSSRELRTSLRNDHIRKKEGGKSDSSMLDWAGL